MSDRDLVSDDERMRVMGHMKHAEVLHVGARSDADGIDVAADDSVKPHAAVLAHHHVPNDDSSIFDEARWGDGGRYALKGPYHGANHIGLPSAFASAHLTRFFTLP